MEDIRLVGLTGAAGCGKDAIAVELSKNSWVRVAFADPLKELCIKFLGLSRDDVYTQLGKIKHNETWGMTNREILQLVGTNALRNNFHEDVWIKIAEMSISKLLATGNRVVVTDVRFDNEAQMITRLGGVVAKVIRPQLKTMLTDAETRHASEAGVDDKHISLTINNNFDLSDTIVNFNRVMSEYGRRHGKLLALVEGRRMPELLGGARKFVVDLRKHILSEKYHVFITDEHSLRLEWLNRENYDYAILLVNFITGEMTLYHGNTHNKVSPTIVSHPERDVWTDLKRLVD